MTKAGVHLANGSQDIARVIALGCGHHLALEMQAEYLAQCPGENHMRLWRKASDDLDTILATMHFWWQSGWRSLIPWNEANIESPEMSYSQIAAAFIALSDALQPREGIVLHWPALSPSRGYRERAADWLPAARLADIVDVHAYGSAAQILEILDWHHSQLPDKEILLTECNPGAGNGFDQAWWATEYLTLLAEADKRPWLRACIGFIWQWHNPDMTLPTTVDWIDQPIEAAVRNRPKEESAVSIAVAILPSNQIQNVSPVQPAYNEKGGMDFLAQTLEATMRAAGINAKAFIGAADTGASVANLITQQDKAAEWIVAQPQTAKLSLNLHTDSGTVSHTFGIFAPRTGEASERCADVISEAAQRVLGTETRRVISKLGAVDYNEYIFATHAKSVAVLIELCTHTLQRDMDALYSRLNQLAQAITEAALLLGGGAGSAPATTDYRAECERMRAELAAATARTAEANKRLGEQASIAKAAISMMEKIRG